MTDQNYCELASYCADLLVLAGFVEKSCVNADGSVNFTTTDLGEEMFPVVLQLLRAAEDPQVMDVLKLIMASPMEEEPEAFTDAQARFRF